jgi:hypothetical protein
MYSLLHEVLEWEVNACFVVSLLFPVVTRLYWPWHKSSWGWNIVMLEIGIAGAIFPSWLFIDFRVSDQPLELVQVISLALVFANVVWRAAMIYRSQRAGALDGEASPGDNRASGPGSSLDRS